MVEIEMPDAQPWEPKKISLCPKHKRETFFAVLEQKTGCENDEFDPNLALKGLFEGKNQPN